MKTIIKQIEKLGYYVGNHKEYLVVGQKTDFDKKLGVNILKNSFSIHFPKEGKYLVEYFVGQMPKEKQFTSDEDLLDFIKQEFPAK